jgi:nitrite reductase/ring-hydroxylating ferredoxin subunit
LTTVFCVALFSCKKDKKNQNNPVPNVSVNINIYPNDPQFAVNIGVTGGWVYLTGGNKGIIVYRKSPTDFVAIERTCTYDPSTNFLIKVQSDNVTLKDTCGSKFLILDGGVTNGPASQGLKTYGTTYDGTTLHIYN